MRVTTIYGWLVLVCLNNEDANYFKNCEYKEKCECDECFMTLGDELPCYYLRLLFLNSKHNDESGALVQTKIC